MSYRRKRDDWYDFVRRNGDELLACGLPDFLIQDKKRFLVFLDHGYDESGWFDNHHAFFDSRALTDAQIELLARIVGEHVDERSGKLIASRWTRYYPE